MFKIIHMEAATPFERGVQYGQQAKREIETAIRYYQKKFAKKFTWEQVLTFAEKFNQVTEGFSPEIMDEIRGIAAGAGRDVREIMAVNARYEISQFDWQHECTTGVFIDQEKDQKFIFKNCDLGRGVSHHLVLLHIIRPDGFRAFGVAEAGQLIRDGYNSKGIALVNSALRSHMDYAGTAVPGTVIRKKVWEAQSFEEACTIQRKRFRTVSTNMLLASREGEAVDFECYPGGEDEVLPTQGIIGTGNRFTVDPTRNRAFDPAIDRGKQLKKLLAEKREEMDTSAIMEILKNHEGYPESICRHADDVGHSTVYSIIINLSTNQIFICFGNPCCNPYQEYRL